MAGFWVNAVSSCFSSYLFTLDRFAIASCPGEPWTAGIREADNPWFYPFAGITEGKGAVCAGAGAVRLVDDAFPVVAAAHADARGQW